MFPGLMTFHREGLLTDECASKRASAPLPSGLVAGQRTHRRAGGPGSVASPELCEGGTVPGVAV